MKKFFLFLFTILCISGLSAAELGYIQPTFGLGGAFFDYYHNNFGNQFGLSAGADIDWDVWKNSGTAAGDLYVGMDLALEYWIPTKHKAESKTNHIIRIPLQANIAYEFKVNAGVLKAVGPWYSMGLGLNVITGDEFIPDDNEYRFQPTFRWGLGATLAFDNNWSLKAGFGGDAGKTKKIYIDEWNWNNNSFFMVEAAARF